MLAASLGFVSLSAFAGGDAALYGPTAPKGSTFVRVYNASSSEISASVGNTSLNEIGPLASSDFGFMPQGDYTAKVGSQSLPVKLASDHYYTIVNNTSGAPQLVEEPPFKNKQKSLVRVQNLSDKALTRPAGSGTVLELDAGVHAIGKKVVEEAAEVWMAAEHESGERTAEEISQLLYHLQVLMIARGLTLDDVYAHL